MPEMVSGRKGGCTMRLYFQTVWAFILAALSAWVLCETARDFLRWQALVNSTERTKQAKAARRLGWRDYRFKLVAVAVAAITIIFCGLVVGAW
jgi:hypothetical protein